MEKGNVSLEPCLNNEFHVILAEIHTELHRAESSKRSQGMAGTSAVCLAGNTLLLGSDTSKGAGEG